MGDTLPDKKLILPLLVVGFATYVVLIGLAFLLPRYLPVKLSDRGIYSFMLAFGNVGFIGYPIVASIFGASAVFYASILNFPSTLLILYSVPCLFQAVRERCVLTGVLSTVRP